MLPKKLFVAAKKSVEKYLLQYKDETKGKTGLSSVPVEVGRGIEERLIYESRNQHVRVTKEMTQSFLLDLAKAKLITPHPWGGWMVPQNEAIPPVSEAKSMALEAMKKLS